MVVRVNGYGASGENALLTCSPYLPESGYVLVRNDGFSLAREIAIGLVLASLASERAISSAARAKGSPVLCALSSCLSQVLLNGLLSVFSCFWNGLLSFFFHPAYSAADSGSLFVLGTGSLFVSETG